MKEITDPFRHEFWRAYQKRFQRPEDEIFLRPDLWDRMAESYDDLEESPFYREMVETVVAEMERIGALSPGLSLLDLCCGTGTYTVRFAPRVKRVVALDVSAGMLAMLRQKIKVRGFENVETVQADWRSWDPGETFDTVFVSLTPVLNDLDQVERILSVTRRYLVLVHWAGLRENELFLEILRRFFKASPRTRSPGAVVLFNYLFSRGFPAEVRFFCGMWERRRPVEKELERVLFRLRGEGYSVNEGVRERIRTFLEERSREGRVLSRTRVRIALLLADLKREALVFGKK